MGEQQAVWERHSAQWEKIGPPLIPCPADWALMEAAIMPTLTGLESPRVGLFGITPQIVQSPWPANTQLQAFDHSAEFIARVWQPCQHIKLSLVYRAKWQNLPLADASLDVIVGDNALGVLPNLAEYTPVLAEVARVLKPGGVLCLRCITLPDVAASPEQLREETLAGQINSFHALKWRIAMALSAAPDYSVETARVHSTFDQLFPDRALLSQVCQWHLAVIDTIDAYRDSTTRYNVAPLAELLSVMARWFDMMAIEYPDYEMGSHCPTLSLKRRDAA